MDETQGFEMTEYSPDAERLGQMQSYLQMIVNDIRQEFPNVGVTVSFTGSLMKLTYHSYEMHLPVRMKVVEEQARETLNLVIKNVKKQYKEKASEALKAKEMKEMANYSVQKVSLNERYVFQCWRYYELS